MNNEQNNKQLPTGWEWKKLGEVCKIFNGNSINEKVKKQKYMGLNKGRPFIGTKDVGFDSTVNYDNGVSIPFEETQFKIASKGVVLICAEGGSAGRKKCILTQDVCFGNKLFAIDYDKNYLIGKFVFYYTFFDSFLFEFKKLMSGIIGGVSSKKFQNIPIPLPPLAEQKRIVKILDEAFEKIDKISANAKQNLNNAKEIFKSALSQEFTITEQKINHGWKEEKLEEVCDVQNGFAFKSNLFKEKGDGIIRISNIQEDSICFNNMVFFDKADYKVNFEKYEVKPNDILIAMSGGTTGKVGINTTNQIFYLNQRVGLFRENKEDLNHYFLYYFLKTKSEESLIISAGSAQPNLSTEQIRNFSIPLPPLSIQQEIVARLDSLSENIKKLESIYNQQIANADELKKSFLQKAFNGEL